ncbi:MAG: PEP-CTERM sorting domain-containing protein [Candidatus Hydrogenedentes bacterium]|nr:PEP-CTERM sorting domain-containing protein [Candidatus Hydrogenedentota bacterium]
MVAKHVKVANTTKKGFCEMKMRKRIGRFQIAATCALAAGYCSVAGAGLVSGITVDGSIGTDWGVATPTGVNGNNWTPTNNLGAGWVQEDSVTGSNGYVGPGYGGQNFDVEALYTGFDISTNRLYVALVTGFDIEGETVSGINYFAGDVFIDFGNYLPDSDNVYDLHAGQRSWDLAFILAGATASDTSLDARQAPFVIDDSPTGAPGYNSGPLSAIGGTLQSGAVAFGYSNNGALDGWTASQDHNVYEFSYEITDQSILNQLIYADTGNNYGWGWTVHWTMSCGNDFLNAAGYLPTGTTFNTPVVPVPAAAPMGLLGLGLVAFARRRKRAAA